MGLGVGGDLWIEHSLVRCRGGGASELSTDLAIDFGRGPWGGGCRYRSAGVDFADSDAPAELGFIE